MTTPTKLWLVTRRVQKINVSRIALPLWDWYLKLVKKHRFTAWVANNLTINFYCQAIQLVRPVVLPLCDTNIGTRDRSFLLEIRCLSHLLWLNQKIFLIGTNGIQKFENLAYSHNFFRFLIALELFLINFQRKIIRLWLVFQPRLNL